MKTKRTTKKGSISFARTRRPNARMLRAMKLHDATVTDVLLDRRTDEALSGKVKMISAKTSKKRVDGIMSKIKSDLRKK